MKTLKLISLVLAIAMLSVCIIGCEQTEKVMLKATVSVIADDNVVFASPVELEVDADKPATILQCVQEALILGDTAYTDDGMSILSIKDYADKVEGDYTYYWEFTVNGAAPETGRAGSINANNEDVIVYTYVKVLTSELIAAEGDDK